jgi:hypothetical protein
LFPQIQENFNKSGLDRVLWLYQSDSSFAIQAHVKLGWFYYRTGRIDNSVQNLLFALIAMKSDIVRSIRATDSDFEFDTLAGILKMEKPSVEIENYLKTSQIYRCLYYLACSEWCTSYSGKAVEIWKLLSILKAAGEYSELSQKQLIKPWIEPPIEVLKRK